MTRALLEFLPRLRPRLPLTILGAYPTRVHCLEELYGEPDARLRDVWIKRDDESNGLYGGNKVRTLEVLFAHALRQGAQRIYSLGGYGSNHAVATSLHAPRVGLESGALLFAQPPSITARDNLLCSLSYADDVQLCSHWSTLPLALWAVRKAAPRASAFHIMPPGGASPLGALGYVSAALEVAEQVRTKKLPAPARIVLPVGSTCTSAGLLAGFALAKALGAGCGLPQIVAVRVSPWPVTSFWRIAWLAKRTTSLVAAWAGRPDLDIPLRQLAARLRVEARFLAEGYGIPSRPAVEAIRRFSAFGERALDTTYSAKAMAAMIQLQEEEPAPSLFWATKSSAPLPAAAPGVASDKRLSAWLRRCIA